MRKRLVTLAILIASPSLGAGPPGSVFQPSQRPASNRVIPIQLRHLALLQGMQRDLARVLQQRTRGLAPDAESLAHKLTAADALDRQLSTLESMLASRPGNGEPARPLADQIAMTRTNLMRMVAFVGRVLAGPLGGPLKWSALFAKPMADRQPAAQAPRTAAEARLLLRTSRVSSVDAMLAAAGGIPRARLPTRDGRPRRERRGADRSTTTTGPPSSGRRPQPSLPGRR